MTATYTIEFSHRAGDAEYRVAAEYSQTAKRLTINLDRGWWRLDRNGYRVNVGPIAVIDWYDWTASFEDEGTFRALVLQEMEDHWPLDLFGRRRPDGNVDILHVDCGSAATRIDRPDVYPVGSDVSTRYEHAAGIVLTPDQCADLGIEIE
jgi:hypothetical protein